MNFDGVMGNTRMNGMLPFVLSALVLLVYVGWAQPANTASKLPYPYFTYTQGGQTLSALDLEDVLKVQAGSKLIVCVQNWPKGLKPLWGIDRKSRSGSGSQFGYVQNRPSCRWYWAPEFSNAEKLWAVSNRGDHQVLATLPVEVI